MIEHSLAACTLPLLAAEWTDENVVRIERKLWLAIATIHNEHGLLSASELMAYHNGLNAPIDLEAIAAEEAKTRHDLKARLNIWNRQCPEGHERIHLGCTSADIVENSMQIRIRRSLFLLDRPEFDRFLTVYPMRGIKGATGTMVDQVNLIGEAGAIALDRFVADVFSFPRLLEATGQMYHRSLDFQVVSLLRSVYDELPWRIFLDGAMTSLATVAGQTWNEGDVSSSSVRRWALPLALMAAGAAEKERRNQ